MTFTIPFTPAVASLWQAYANSNLMGKGIVVLQVVLSIVVWSVMVGKWAELKRMDATAHY